MTAPQLATCAHCGTALQLPTHACQPAAHERCVACKRACHCDRDEHYHRCVR